MTTRGKRLFYEVTINGRTYARFDKYEHAQVFAKAVEAPGLGVAIWPVDRGRL